MAASKPMLEEGISTQASVCWREHEIRFSAERINASPDPEGRLRASPLRPVRMH